VGWVVATIALVFKGVCVGWVVAATALVFSYNYNPENMISGGEGCLGQAVGA